MIGFFLGYPTEKNGYRVMLGDTVVTSVHVLFDEDIPERSADYFKELDEAKVAVDPEERHVADFDYLVGRCHEDGGLMYKITRVVVRKGLIVGYRALINSGREQIEDKTPIHVSDLKEMTEDLARRMSKGTVDHDDGNSGVVPDEHQEDVRPPSNSVATPGERTPTVNLEEQPTNRRARAPRVITNVAVLGEMHHIGDDFERTLHQEADDVWMTADVPPDPQTHQESVECAEHKHWSKARQREREGLAKRDVLEMVPIPPGVKPMKSRYVYKTKRNRRGGVKKKKARMVVLGYGQKGDGSENYFAPVVKSITVRLLLAIAFMFSMFVHQLDVSNAFCYADIEGDVYVMPTPDYKLPPNYCFRLKKSLYGLRSSPRSWWKHLDKFIKSLHFKACILDPCLYYMKYKGKLVLLTIYVDDILIACTDIEIVKEIKAKFCDKFDMDDMGELAHFLNVRVTRTARAMKLDQTVYAEKVLKQWESFLGPKDKTRKSPLPNNTSDQLKADEPVYTQEEQEYVDNFPYRPILGALLYLSMNTRPDIAYAVGVLSRYGSKPTLTTCKLMVYLMQYLRGTIEKGIEFSGSKFDLHIFTDADWAGEQLSRKSTTGYVAFAVGGPIIWQSKLQATVATSSMQSEYQAMYAGMQELVWIRGVMTEIGLQILVSKPSPFFLDSQSAEDLAKNPVYHKRSKHIEIKYHWIREHVNPDMFNTARLIHVSTHEQSADMYTKALVGPTMIKHRERNLGKKYKSSQEVEQDVPKAKRRR